MAGTVPQNGAGALPQTSVPRRHAMPSSPQSQEGKGHPMSQQNVALIRGIYDAFASGDVPGLLGAMSPDIVWNEAENFPYADSNPYVGPMAVAQGVFARCGGEWNGFAAVPEEILDAGDTVVALGHYLGSYKAT